MEVNLIIADSAEPIDERKFTILDKKRLISGHKCTYYLIISTDEDFTYLKMKYGNINVWPR